MSAAITVPRSASRDVQAAIGAIKQRIEANESDAGGAVTQAQFASLQQQVAALASGNESGGNTSTTTITAEADQALAYFL